RVWFIEPVTTCTRIDHGRLSHGPSPTHSLTRHVHRFSKPLSEVLRPRSRFPRSLAHTFADLHGPSPWTTS
ncbi:MAG: hypothetical protein ACPG77_01345, partial [Nannocystaceae bacterium]